MPLNSSPTTTKMLPHRLPAMTKATILFLILLLSFPSIVNAQDADANDQPPLEHQAAPPPIEDDSEPPMLEPPIGDVPSTEQLQRDAADEQLAWSLFFGADGHDQSLTKAREMFQRQADDGVASAQFALGVMYATGIGVDAPSQSKALLYYTFAAASGHHLGHMALAYRYWRGLSVDYHCETAATHYAQVAQRSIEQMTLVGGPTVYRLRLADEADSGGGGSSGQLDPEFVQYYQYLADKGDISAQAGLGALYLHGRHGVQVDYFQAKEYLEQASEAESSQADAQLGRMYLQGTEATPRDDKLAFEYFSKAAARGSAGGELGLGMMFLAGRYVERDIAQSRKYFTMAAEQGNGEAQLQLGIFLFKGVAGSKSPKQALKFLNMASQQGNALAYFNLAQIHAHGLGVPRMCRIAAEFYKNVAERGRWSQRFTDAYRHYHAGDYERALVAYAFLAELGYEVAQSNLAFMHERFETSTNESESAIRRAFVYWDRSAQQGYSQARIKLGDFHYYGMGTKVDFAEAANQYRQAAENQQSAQAMFNLAYMHERGVGIKKDIFLAKRYYDLAAETSADAYFPASLALLKLALLFFWDSLKQSALYSALPDVAQWLGSEHWDLYLISVIAGLLGVVFALRRRG